MADEGYTSSELRAILDEFLRIRQAYVALQGCCEMQEETLSVERERSERMKDNLRKLSEAYSLLEKGYRTSLEKLQTERDDLRKTVEELKEQCDHLRLLAADRNGNDEQVYRLQDEVETMKAQLAFQEEKHGEDVALLKQQHSDEMQRYKVLLQNAKLASNSQTETKKRGRAKGAKKNVTHFRWPELNVDKVTNTPVETRNQIGNRNKKRKLYCEDREAEIDIS